MPYAGAKQFCRRNRLAQSFAVWMGGLSMARAKQASKRNRRSKALPVLGIAGMSLAVAGGASASTGLSATDLPSQNTTPRHDIFLGEEEISDVSLSTFYVFDKENAAKPQLGEKLAWRGCGGCRCGGCRCGCGGCGWRACAGCGGCGGCCFSWGRCRVC
jgi:hypothetical protein